MSPSVGPWIEIDEVSDRGNTPEQFVQCACRWSFTSPDGDLTSTEMAGLTALEDTWTEVAELANVHNHFSQLA